jgi:hypothetical protein
MHDRASDGLNRRNSAKSALARIDPTGRGGGASRFSGHIDAVNENRWRPEPEK